MSSYIKEIRDRGKLAPLGQLCYYGRKAGDKWSELHPNALKLAKSWAASAGMVWPVEPVSDSEREQLSEEYPMLEQSVQPVMDPDWLDRFERKVGVRLDKILELLEPEENARSLIDAINPTSENLDSVQIGQVGLNRARCSIEDGEIGGNNKGKTEHPVKGEWALSGRYNPEMPTDQYGLPVKSEEEDRGDWLKRCLPVLEQLEGNSFDDPVLLVATLEQYGQTITEKEAKAALLKTGGKK